MASVQQLSLDLDEIKRLLGLTNRSRVKEVLMTEQHRLEKEITQLKLQQQTLNSDSKDGTDSTTSPKYATAQPQLATKVIKSYGWDQSEKFVKIYVTLPEVHTIPAANIAVEFTSDSFVLDVKSLKKANHQLGRKNLVQPILPEGSHHKVKTDSVVVFLKKAEKHQWSFLTKMEQKTKEAKAPKYDDKGDPGDSMMKMMKNMYDEGDDDMKRQIAKAWTESQDKKTGGGGLGGPGGAGAGLEGLGGLGGLAGLGGAGAGLGGLGGLAGLGGAGGLAGLGGAGAGLGGLGGLAGLGGAGGAGAGLGGLGGLGGADPSLGGL